MGVAEGVVMGVAFEEAVEAVVKTKKLHDLLRPDPEKKHSAAPIFVPQFWYIGPQFYKKLRPPPYHIACIHPD